jgi:hypothetical protein
MLTLGGDSGDYHALTTHLDLEVAVKPTLSITHTMQEGGVLHLVEGELNNVTCVAEGGFPRSEVFWTLGTSSSFTLLDAYDKISFIFSPTSYLVSSHSILSIQSTRALHMSMLYCTSVQYSTSTAEPVYTTSTHVSMLVHSSTQTATHSTLEPVLILIGGASLVILSMIAVWRHRDRETGDTSYLLSNERHNRGVCEIPRDTMAVLNIPENRSQVGMKKGESKALNCDLGMNINTTIQSNITLTRTENIRNVKRNNVKQYVDMKAPSYIFYFSKPKRIPPNPTFPHGIVDLPDECQKPNSCLRVQAMDPKCSVFYCNEGCFSVQ